METRVKNQFFSFQKRFTKQGRAVYSTRGWGRGSANSVTVTTGAVIAFRSTTLPRTKSAKIAVTTVASISPHTPTSFISRSACHYRISKSSARTLASRIGIGAITWGTWTKASKGIAILLGGRKISTVPAVGIHIITFSIAAGGANGTNVSILSTVCLACKLTGII